jgi:hypothetical protein|tara:strand:+ start:116 stop:286 length:171 start_codon:yes stop_codon:yes gene_type:complete
MRRDQLELELRPGPVKKRVENVWTLKEEMEDIERAVKLKEEQVVIEIFQDIPEEVA